MNQHRPQPIDLARPLPRLALRPQEAADCIGVSLTTWLTLVEEGRMPKPVRIGRICLYDMEAVRNCWLALRDGDAEDKPDPFD